MTKIRVRSNAPLPMHTQQFSYPYFISTDKAFKTLPNFNTHSSNAFDRNNLSKLSMGKQKSINRKSGISLTKNQRSNSVDLKSKS